MTTIFKPTFFQNNRKQLRQACGDTGLIIVAANGLLQRSADTTYQFSQDANFWYLTGLDEPDLLLVMDGEDEYLIVPGRSVSRQAFDGSISDEDITKRSLVHKIYDEHEGWELIARKLKSTKTVGILGAPSSFIKSHGLYTNPTRKRLQSRLLKLEPEIECSYINEQLRDLRVIKQPSEIKAIQKAIDITVESFNDSFNPSLARHYKYEYEIEANITKGIRSRGATGHAYEPIVASGQRACTLHYIDNNGELGKDELIVIDVGAEVEHYAADITRTVCLGSPSKRQKEVFKKVLEVHKFACQQLGPGVTMQEYEKSVRDFLGTKLVELGLAKEVTHDATIKYYPHSTSHFLGLNVHDVGDYDKPLKAGMVLTVEPGIYIPEEGIGVRLEDDVLITPTGIKILTSKLPKNMTLGIN